MEETSPRLCEMLLNATGLHLPPPLFINNPRRMSLNTV